MIGVFKENKYVVHVASVTEAHKAQQQLFQLGYRWVVSGHKFITLYHTNYIILHECGTLTSSYLKVCAADVEVINIHRLMILTRPHRINNLLKTLNSEEVKS
jgi:hypothetical protein